MYMSKVLFCTTMHVSLLNLVLVSNMYDPFLCCYVCVTIQFCTLYDHYYILYFYVCITVERLIQKLSFSILKDQSGPNTLKSRQKLLATSNKQQHLNLLYINPCFLFK